MALNLSIDLTDATFADLAALVEAARTAGIDPATDLVLEDTTLTIRADGDPDHAQPRGRRYRHDKYDKFEMPERPGPSAGTDAALKFIAELLGGNERGDRR